MKRQYKLIIGALGVVALLIAAVATTALAAQKVNVPGTTTPTQADYQAWGCPVANGNYEAVAGLLGMTAQEIETRLEQGKSLVEIAASKGVSEDQVVAVIFEPMKEFMKQQATAGVWTQAQLDSHLNVAEQHVRQLVNAKGGINGNGGCGGAGAGGMMGGSSGMMGGYGGMMRGWGTNNGGTFGSGGMMGGGYGGRTGGFGNMMGISY